MRLWRNRQTRYLEGVVSIARMGSSPINRTMKKITQILYLRFCCLCECMY